MADNDRHNEVPRLFGLALLAEAATAVRRLAAAPALPGVP
jgi:hypothetical protein